MITNPLESVTLLVLCLTKIISDGTSQHVHDEVRYILRSLSESPAASHVHQVLADALYCLGVYRGRDTGKRKETADAAFGACVYLLRDTEKAAAAISEFNASK